MNRSYRLIWNRTLGVLQVASELARSSGGNPLGSNRQLRRAAQPHSLRHGLAALGVATAGLGSVYPSYAEDLIINEGTSFVADSDKTYDRLEGHNNSVLNMQGHNLTVGPSIYGTNTDFLGDIINIGDFTKQGAGKFTLRGNYTGSGSFKVKEGVLELGSGGWMRLPDSGITVAATSETPAKLDIRDGGQLSMISGVLGNSENTIGVANVTEDGSTWIVQALLVGDAGTGTLNIKNGGQISSYSVFIGNRDTGKGTVTVSDSESQLNMGLMLSVGVGGLGELTIDNGGKVSSRDAIIGHNPTGNGTVTVSGNGSQLKNVIGPLFVGNYGPGELNIREGGTVTSESVYIGLENLGVVKLSGVGSQFQVNKDLFIGYQSAGDGAVTIENDAVLAVRGRIALSTMFGAKGHLELEHGRHASTRQHRCDIRDRA